MKRHQEEEPEETESEESIDLNYSDEEMAFDAVSVGTLKNAIIQVLIDHPALLEVAIQRSSVYRNLCDKAEKLDRLPLTQILPKRPAARSGSQISRNGRPLQF